MDFEKYRKFFKNADCFFSENRDIISASNLFMLRHMSVLYALCLFAYVVFSLFIRHRVQIIISSVALFLQLLLIVFIHIYSGSRSHSFAVTEITCYVFGALIAMLSIFDGIVIYPGLPAFIFPLVIILLMQIYTLSYRCLTLYLIIWGLIFLPLSYFFKSPDVFTIDLVSTLIAYVISFTSYFTLLGYKVRDFMAQKRLRHLSSVDRMTGVLNKVSFQEYYCKFVATLGEYRPFSLIIFDMDCFKQINDQHGHSLGDAVLVEFARLITAYFSSYGDKCKIGRFGGDEFIALVPDCGNITKLSNDVSELIFQASTHLSDKFDVSVAFSAGLALSSLHNNSYDEMFRKADRALLHAKLERKGTCYVYDADKNPATN